MDLPNQSALWHQKKLTACSYFHSLHYLVKTHALKPPQVNEVMDMFEETRLVELLDGSLAPKLVRDDLRHHSLAKGRDAGDRGRQVDK